MTDEFFSINKKLIEILKLIPNNDKLKFSGENAEVLTKNGPILEISYKEIIIPGLPFPPLLENPSPLKDSFVDMKDIEKFLNIISKDNLFCRINHIGFCYKVSSVNEEKKRLIDLCKKSKWELYEEESNDGSPWLFLGNKNNWNDPLVEIIPVEKTTDQWINYWLPHIQIDIQTNLLGTEIEDLIKNIFKGRIKPYRLFETKGFIFLIRSWLGTINGVNFDIDIGAEGRMLRYHRKKLLKIQK